MPYPGYQCFKTQSRDVYCSVNIVRSHPEGSLWISRAIANYGLRANEIKGKPYIIEDESNIPQDANRFG